MSRMTPYVQIGCDDCGTWQETMKIKMRDARRYMSAKYGWTTRRKDGKLLDLCPECKVKP